ncbi:hypothetical protein JW848_01670 [Candidatus Bipolaricaulota bacterium]|nr:hypothetical protein [Candidatus Bipolaricaulota bacterium]
MKTRRTRWTLGLLALLLLLIAVGSSAGADEWDNLGGSIWDAIDQCADFGLIEVCISDLIPFGRSTFISFVNGVTWPVRQLVSQMENVVDAALGPLGGILTEVRKLPGIFDGVNGMISMAGSFASGGKFFEIAGKLGDLTSGLNGGFGSITGFTGNLQNAIIGTLNSPSSLFGGLKTALEDAAGEAIGAFDEAFDWFGILAQLVKGDLSGLTRLLESQFTQLGSLLGGQIGDLGSITGIIETGFGDGLGGIEGMLEDGFYGLTTSLGGLGDRLTRIVGRLERLGTAMADVAMDPASWLDSLAMVNELLPMLPGLLLSTSNCLGNPATGPALAAIIDDLPEIAATLPDLAEFAYELPVLMTELGTNLIREAPAIIEGLPDLLTEKIDGLFLNISEDATTLLSLIPMASTANDILAMGDQTMGEIQAQVDRIQIATATGFESLAEALSLRNSGQEQLAASIEQLESEIVAAHARNAELRAEHACLLEEPSFGDDAVLALTWLLEHESDEVRNAVALERLEMSPVQAAYGGTQ